MPKLGLLFATIWEIMGGQSDSPWPDLLVKWLFLARWGIYKILGTYT